MVNAVGFVLVWLVFASIDLIYTLNAYHVVQKINNKNLSFNDMEANIILKRLLKWFGVPLGFAVMYLLICALILVLDNFGVIDSFYGGVLYGSYILLFILHGHTLNKLEKALKKKEARLKRKQEKRVQKLVSAANDWAICHHVPIVGKGGKEVG